jgi:SAM-dependent methyltransferase
VDTEEIEHGLRGFPRIQENANHIVKQGDGWMTEQTKGNGETWSRLAKTHYEHYHVPKLLAGESLLSDLIREEVGDVRGKSLIHLLCHIGTDTLSWGLLGAQVTGVDISGEALKYAGQIARDMKMEAAFIESDVMELSGKIQDQYEIVFASTGVLCWIPDINRLAVTVRGLLKPGGFFYLHDGHPLRNVLGKNEAGETIIREDYFHQGGWGYEGFVDYASPDVSVPGKVFEWQWTMGDVVTALCNAGLRIEFLHEFPQYFYSGYTAFDVVEGKLDFAPCTFSIKAVAA